MYLSKLEINGFKSFAQKTSIRFDAGITAIVGPNGCGKTNVADAIRWVLGEQKASTLRSDKMENVIFNGTKNRKPLGMSEVSLTIENTKKILPTEYSEVTLTRRLYRSGESEYLMNKVPCRLKDIIDMFMDTGMGSDAYSVIELKMIEDILSERHDDRRKLFEEAAGVTKYKTRRKQALRKLEQTQTDLVRIKDLLAEVQKTVNSLERQAKKAEQYKVYADDLKKCEIEMAEREFSNITQKLIPLNEQLKKFHDEIVRFSSELGVKESGYEKAKVEMVAMEQELSLLQKQLNLHLQEIEKINQSLILNKERKINHESNIKRAEDEKKLTIQSIGDLEKQVIISDEKILNFKNLIESSENAYNLVQETSRSFETHLTQKRNESAEINRKAVGLINDLSGKKTELERLKTRRDSSSQRTETIEKENEGLVEQIEDLTNNLDELRYSEKQILESISLTEEKVKNHTENIEKTRQLLVSTRETLSSIQIEIQSKNQRKSFLNSIYESFEGVPEGVRFLIKESKTKNITTFSDIFNLKKEEWLPVVTHWLADRVNFLIADNEHHALDQLALLKTQRKGIASFILLDRVDTTDLKKTAVEGVQHLSDLISTNEKYTPLCQSLFNGVYVVEEDEIGAKLFKQYPYFTFLTKSGLIFSDKLFVKGGQSGHEGPSRIGIAEKIKELETEIIELENKKKAQEDNIQQQKDLLDKLLVSNPQNELRESQRQHIELEKNISQIDYTIKNTQSRIEKNKLEISKLNEDDQLLGEQIDELLPEIDEAQYEITKLQKQSDEFKDSLQKLESEWQMHASQAQDARAKLVAFQGEHQNAINEKQRFIEQAEALKNQIAKRELEILQSNEQIETAEKEVQVADETLIGLLQKKEEMANEVDKKDLDYQSKRGGTNKLDDEIRQLLKSKELSNDLANQTQLKISENELKINNIKERIFNDYELTLTLKEFDDADPFDHQKMTDEIRRLRDRIKVLGAVNPLALQEFETEKARLDEMNTQLNDIISAEKTLLETIEEINQTAQAQFLDVFAKIRENFNMTFHTLFEPGDEADLKLEEGVDPLEAKIEISARPRGKRPQSITLLSGGEKTLTAIALLFAIYLVKPSPFCILDEVDAPLDDANIDRYTKIIKKFSEETQFIMITHNKRTMESANMMYGVTMEEKGVSKVVSVQFNEEKKAG